MVAPSLSAAVWHDGRELFTHNPARVYDLASLTKVLATTEVVLRAVESGRLDLDGGHPLLPPNVTIAQLLSHSAGMLWWKDLSALRTRAAVLQAALAEPLVTAPGLTHVYSDLSFLSLGAVIEAVMGARMDALWHGPLRWGDALAEPTENGLRGVVHDDNARCMGGVAPHAGLFGNARQVLAVATRWLRAGVPLSQTAFTRRGAGSHVLGWDTPSGEASSAGPRPPADAVGHTGFTGTSVWMSPSRRIIAVLLTNRVAFGRDAARIRSLRHEWHQCVWDAIDSGPP